MIAQILLSMLLLATGLYAWKSFRRAPPVAVLVALAALAGFYFVWLPAHATWLAAAMGIGRGVDLVLYVWVVVSLLAILNLHLIARSQLELITVLARKLAIAQAVQSVSPKTAATDNDAG